MEVDTESWEMFVVAHGWPRCWWCGRGRYDRPDWWHTNWLVERAHIVSKPRLKDRRVAVLLCSLCHRVQHGDLFGSESPPRPTLSHLLWLKKHYDYAYWDRKVLAYCHIGRLPQASSPPRCVVEQYERYRSRCHE